MITPKKYRHAVVLGGSFSGCIFARVMSDYAEKVTVIEKDPCPDEHLIRRGVPQEHHVHLLLVRGRQMLETLYPGITAELELNGAMTADLSRDIKCFQYGNWNNRYETGIQAHYSSRSLIDRMLRRFTRKLDNVEFRHNSRAVGFSLDQQQRTITQVNLSSEGVSDIIDADFVVDTSGRGSRALAQLRELGFTPPETEVVPSKLGYVSCLYQRKPEFEKLWKVLLILPDPKKVRRLGVISPIENDQWMVTLGSAHDDCPKADDDSFLDFARNLPTKDLYEIIADGERISPIHSFNISGAKRLRFDKAYTLPGNFLVGGDALCHFNPFYSQGMTVCSLQAEAFQAELAKPRTDSKSLQLAVSQVTNSAWEAAKSEDQRFAHDDIAKPISLRVRHWYTAHLAKAVGQNENVAKKSLLVGNFLEEPSSLFSAETALQVFGTNLRQVLMGAARG